MDIFGKNGAVTAATGNVAIVIVNFNGGALLEESLKAIEAQTWRPRGVIVVDNASTDGSADNLESQHATVKVIRCPENFGFAKGNNIGIAAADDSEWVACLNPDAFPDPDWLERFVSDANACPDFDFFGCKMLQADDSGRLDGTGDVYHVSGLAWRRDHGRIEKDGVNEKGEIFAPCAAAALYRRAALLDVGGFDESFFCYFEDVDLAFRLRLKGYRCCYLPEARVRHVGSAITGRRSDFSVYHGHRNLVWTFFKNMPGGLFWLYLPLHFLLNLASIVAYCFSGRAGAILRAKRDALRGMGGIWAARKAIQAERTVPSWEINRLMAKSLIALIRRT